MAYRIERDYRWMNWLKGHIEDQVNVYSQGLESSGIEMMGIEQDTRGEIPKSVTMFEQWWQRFNGKGVVGWDLPHNRNLNLVAFHFESYRIICMLTVGPKMGVEELVYLYDTKEDMHADRLKLEGHTSDYGSGVFTVTNQLRREIYNLPVWGKREAAIGLCKETLEHVLAWSQNPDAREMARMRTIIDEELLARSTSVLAVQVGHQGRDKARRIRDVD